MSTQPPGPNGVPVFGNALHYARDPFRFMEACGRAYGDVVSLALGPREAYMLTNPEDVERVLVHEADRYEKADFGNAAVDDLLGNGLLLSEGSFWRQQRQLMTPAFKMDRIAAFAETMTDYAESMVAGWTPGDVVDVETELQRATVKIIVDAMFDVQLGDDRVEDLAAALEPVGARFEPNPMRRFIPDWAPTEENRAFQDGVDTIESVLDDIMDQRTARGDVEDGDDLLAILLRARDDPEYDLDDGQVRDELVTMLLAGHDTTALALTYTFYLLAENPEERARVEAEIDETVGDGRPTMGDVPALDRTERALEESMRLYPPAYSLYRQPTDPVTFQGYDVDTGSILFLPQWVVHRDPRWWDDPEAFDPDRFTDDRASDRPGFAYFPFGGGPRHCIGKRFSMLEAQLILGTVLRDYRLENARDRSLDLRGTITMHPEGGMPMRVVER
jgi:cytochrome P450